MSKQLKTTEQIASILGISQHTVRDYKEKGLFEIAAKDGNKDMYDPKAIQERWQFIQEKRRQEKSLREIANLINLKRVK